jgi:hypothetical protein
VGKGVWVGVNVFVGLGVMVGVSEGGKVSVTVGEGVREGREVLVATGVRVLVLVGVAPVLATVGVRVRVEGSVGEAVSVTVGVKVGVVGGLGRWHVPLSGVKNSDTLYMSTASRT